MGEHDLNKNLFLIMNGEGDKNTDGQEDSESRSPVKNKLRKLGLAATKLGNATKHKVKSALKASFIDNHVDKFPRVLAEGSVQLNGDTPVQEFIMNLQELLKNGQLVNKTFALCPVKEDGRDKRIQDPSGVLTNMTLLSAYCKILSMKGRNPFEKQKVWKNNKEVKGKVRNPIIYFAFAFATDKEPDDLLARVSHE